MAINGRQYDWEDAAAVATKEATDGDSRRSVTPVENKRNVLWR